MFTHVCAGACAHACMDVSRGQRITSRVILYEWSILSFQTCLGLPGLNLQAHPGFFFFFECECWGLNSRPHASKASTFMTELSFLISSMSQTGTMIFGLQTALSYKLANNLDFN